MYIFDIIELYDSSYILRLSCIDYLLTTDNDRSEYSKIYAREVLKSFLDEFKNDQEVSQLFIHMLNIYNLI